MKVTFGITAEQPNEICMITEQFRILGHLIYSCVDVATDFNGIFCVDLVSFVSIPCARAVRLYRLNACIAQGYRIFQILFETQEYYHTLPIIVL